MFEINDFTKKAIEKTLPNGTVLVNFQKMTSFNHVFNVEEDYLCVGFENNDLQLYAMELIDSSNEDAIELVPQIYKKAQKKHNGNIKAAKFATEQIVTIMSAIYVKYKTQVDMIVKKKGQSWYEMVIEDYIIKLHSTYKSSNEYLKIYNECINTGIVESRLNDMLA